MIDKTLESWNNVPDKIPKGSPYFKWNSTFSFAPLLLHIIHNKIIKAIANDPIPKDGTNTNPDCSGGTKFNGASIDPPKTPVKNASNNPR